MRKIYLPERRHFQDGVQNGGRPILKWLYLNRKKIYKWFFTWFWYLDIVMVIQYHTCVKWEVKLYFVGVSGGSSQHPDPKERIQGAARFWWVIPRVNPSRNDRVTVWGSLGGWGSLEHPDPKERPGVRYGSSEPPRVQNGQGMTEIQCCSFSFSDRKMVWFTT